MIQSATGIILRTRPLTDTSLIVNWLTPDLGRINTAAKSARGNKSPFRGKLDLFYEADFSLSRSVRSDLHTLREVRICETHAELRKDLAYLEQAAYAAALIEQTTEKETPLPEIFGLFREFLNSLTMRPPQPRTVFAFEFKLLAILGLNPDLDQSRLGEGTRKIVRQLTEIAWCDLSRLQPTPAEARELHRFLQGYLIFHLGKIPRQRATAIRG